jgi:hypothetical protein
MVSTAHYSPESPKQVSINCQQSEAESIEAIVNFCRKARNSDKNLQSSAVVIFSLTYPFILFHSFPITS